MTTKTMIAMLLGTCLLLIGCDDTTKKTEGCGNGLLDLGEECDGDAGDATTCADLGYYEQFDPVRCGVDCRWDLSVCAGRCGDGVIQVQHGEDCEGDNLGGDSCITLGYEGGTLACNSLCRHDLSACEAGGDCGNGIVEAPEQCEETDLQGETCESLGYHGGVLACAGDCTLDLAACESFGRCGDGVIQEAYAEECEGADLQEMTCNTLGFYGGALACAADCTLDLSACEAVGRCGDGEIQPMYEEECDSENLDGQTCESMGQYAGTLACSDCQVDASGCGGECGDGTLQSTFETCDGADLGAESCRTQSFFTGPLSCDTGACSLDTTGCLNITEIAAGASHTCAILTDGTVRCWGRNNQGQLGDGTTTNRTSPVQVIGLSNAAKLTLGNWHSCALLVDGTVRCWGDNSYGQLGDGTTIDRFQYVTVSGLSNIISVDTGYSHTCVVKADQTAWCFGRNSNGALGDGTLTDRALPVQVTGLTTVDSISAGNSFTCALLANKTVRCWGENGFGQLGNGSTLDTVAPVEPAVTNVNSLSAGDMHVCVTTSMTIPLSRNGYCWGSNGYGQLGDGTTTNRLVPTQINFTFSSARLYYIYSGDFHTCMHSSAAGTFSTASCWGFNASGQLGDGTTIDRTSPIDTGWTAPRLAIGSMHTCLATGSPLNILRCWGQNNQDNSVTAPTPADPP